MLQGAGLRVLEAPVAKLLIRDNQIAAWHLHDGTEHRFDAVYTALGTRVRSDLTRTMGAQTDEDGALLVDGHQRTSIEGLYAAGDVVRGLSQISVAMGQGAIGATAINGSLDLRAHIIR